MESSICISCGRDFEFNDSCYEFDDGDMCARCYRECCERLAEELRVEVQEESDAS